MTLVCILAAMAVIFAVILLLRHMVCGPGNPYTPVFTGFDSEDVGTGKNFNFSDFVDKTFKNSRKFHKVHFHHGGFTNSTLEDVNFQSSELNWVSFTNGGIAESDFRNADFHCGKITKVRIIDTSFRNAKFWCTKFIGGKLKNVDFRGAELHHVEFHSVDFENVKFDSLTDVWGSVFDRKMKPVLKSAGVDISEVEWRN